jgi:hypothetical protein
MAFRKYARFALFVLSSLAVPSLAAAADGFVQFFADKDFKGSAVTINAGTNVPDMKTIATDDGHKGFNDRASSVKYQVPTGWEAVIYDDANYQQRVYVLRGTGEMKDLSKVEDKSSSLRWESTGMPSATTPVPAAPAPAPTPAPSTPPASY